jgi:hypothetical protein
MSTEAIANRSEVTSQHNVLPSGDALHDIYRLEFTSLDLPDTYQTTSDYHEANVTYAGPNPDIQQLRDSFVSQAAEKAYNDSWWQRASEALKAHGADPEVADNLVVAAKHNLSVVVDGKPTNQGFEVFEVGEREADEGAVKTVFDTLRLIDQYSGGLLAADPDRPCIALANGIRLGQNRTGGEKGGIAAPGAVVINMSALKDIAKEADADLHELLAIVIVHEVLGHSLERLTMNGKTGLYFARHFDYSNNRVPGKIFEGIHESIQPKEAAKNGSQPVREYGKVNAAEDFATSVDAVVAQAMGWSSTADKMPRFQSEVDTHRSDLAIGLMQNAARLALKHEHTHGFVGSELRYITDAKGRAVGVEPARKFEVTSFYDDGIVQREIENMVAKYDPGNEFIVTEGDLV